MLAKIAQNPLNRNRPVHGNSLNSPRETYLYELVDENGNHLKYGISSDPYHRYTQEFMKDKYMNIIDQGSRRDMYRLEHEMILNNPRGPLQRNGH
jgi:hypothetical protein